MSAALTLAFLPSAGLAQDANPSAGTCREHIVSRMAREQRLYRGVIFGRSSAEDAAVGEVRYDRNNKAWYKSSLDVWRLVEETQPSTTQSDSAMDVTAEQDSIQEREGAITFPRRGILDTKRALTSDLIPYLTQSIRTLSCRVQMVCDAASQSLDVETGQPREDITVHVEGCIPIDTQTHESCHLTSGSNYDEIAEVESYCYDVADKVIQREIELLKLLVEYDAAYRSVLQFSGIFDAFLLEFRWTLASNIREAASMISTLSRIPCFLGICEEWPPELDPHDLQGSTDNKFNPNN